jgi:hypothetical protein
MISLSDIRYLAEDLNEQAHQETWDTWREADRLEESLNESDWELAEAQRELASRQQAEWFRDLYYDLTDDQQRAVAYWLEHDPDFHDEFQSWFGEEEFHRVFGGSDLSDGGDPD